MTASTAVVRPTREHVEALALAAADAAFSRALALMACPLDTKVDDDPKVQAARRDDQEARDRLRAALDSTFAELDRLRAEVAR